MNANLEKVFSILRPRVDHPLLEGLFEVIFNQDQKKFYAFTYTNINSDKYFEIRYYLEKMHAYGVYCDNERTKKYIDDKCWQIKSAEECIADNIFTHFGMIFIGMFYENEWYINEWLDYFGPPVDEKETKRILKFHGQEFDIWNSYPFTDSIGSFTNDKYRDVEKEEFQDLPPIVALKKQEAKKELNIAFRRYINEEVFRDFSRKLKIQNPEKYSRFYFAFTEDFILVFPANKKYILMVAGVIDSEENLRIEYFAYIVNERKIYQRNYFSKAKRESKYQFEEYVTEDLGKISEWNYPRFLNSSRTMDDENFWSNYVFKKEKGEYVYLKEIEL